MDTGFRLGDWEVRPRHGTLLRDGQDPEEVVRVEPRVMAVLVCLAHHVGQVVTRDEFSADVWGGRIVSDEALSRCISVLRQLLGDDTREPRFIRTIARIGYTLEQTPAPLTAPCTEGGALPTVPPAQMAAHRERWITRLWSPAKHHPYGAAVSAVFGIAVALTVGYFLLKAHPKPDAPALPITRLLVLAFASDVTKPAGRDIGIELADQIADSLAHVDRLQVSGRTSADSLAAAHADAVEAGRRLGADAVLSGKVDSLDAGLRVAVRLTSVKDGHALWSRVFERESTDSLAAQSSIATAIVRELLGLMGREGLAGMPSNEPEERDPQAYQLYLRGAHQVRLRGEDSLRRAVDLFSAAARRDPTYARAQIGLASAYALLPSYSYEDPDEMYALAEKALANADRLSHNRSESAGTRGYLDFMRGRWIDSEIAFRTAIVADPNNPEVRQMYSQLLGAMGRIEAALAQVRLAQDIDPLAPVVADRLGILNLWLGHDAEAASDAALARELGLDEVAYPETKIILKLHQHEDAAAADDLRALRRTLHRSVAWVGPAVEAYRHPEKRPAVIELLDQTLAEGGISARVYFGIMVLLESPARALRGFAALPDRGGNDLEFMFSSDAAAVRADPKFGEFVRSMGIEAYWDRFGWPKACRRDGARIVCH
jgi:DNA-binding winged helix-turn-helix (wHTH) protein/TolB-like protein